jgi:hypothetical protein
VSTASCKGEKMNVTIKKTKYQQSIPSTPIASETFEVERMEPKRVATVLLWIFRTLFVLALIVEIIWTIFSIFVAWDEYDLDYNSSYDYDRGYHSSYDYDSSYYSSYEYLSHSTRSARERESDFCVFILLTIVSSLISIALTYIAYLIISRITIAMLMAWHYTKETAKTNEKMLNEMRCLRNQLASSEEEESLSSDEIRAFLDSKQQADNA